MELNAPRRSRVTFENRLDGPVDAGYYFYGVVTVGGGD